MTNRHHPMASIMCGDVRRSRDHARLTLFTASEYDAVHSREIDLVMIDEDLWPMSAIVPYLPYLPQPTPYAGSGHSVRPLPSLARASKPAAAAVVEPACWASGPTVHRAAAQPRCRSAKQGRSRLDTVHASPRWRA